MRFWVMALRAKDDGSRPSMREALDAGAIHATREACLADAEGVLPRDQWQPVAVEVRLLTKILPPPAAPEGEEGTP